MDTPRADDDLARLPGLGPTSAMWLAGEGVRDRRALRERDPIELYLRLRRRHARASLNLLYALIGAQEGIDWRAVARERRTSLLNEIDARTRHARPR